MGRMGRTSRNERQKMETKRWESDKRNAVSERFERDQMKLFLMTLMPAEMSCVRKSHPFC